ncbi:GMC family oxidoreductase [Chryseobacterium sp. 2987]|uniref:GMC family oxidoreductase n=1 Tax=Chryseobacterium sp. 2987 TaxID=2817767 RepID=UPI00285A8F74|nr:GMC family oxidoreductase [Chryseobacterium sp. 2987]MDR6923804.1 choline dehydrogenase-like flavoprotein [Chryseobacterium sp. 2987]
MRKPTHKKDVIIVGTGIAGSLIAKLLTDHVYSLNGKKFIHRTAANLRFKEILAEIDFESVKKLEHLPASASYQNEINNSKDRTHKEIDAQAAKKNIDPKTLENRIGLELFKTYFFLEFYHEISILMYEAGLEAGVELDSVSSMTNYTEYMRTFYTQEAKVPNSPYPNLKQAPSPNVLNVAQITPPFPDKKGYLVQFGPMAFASDAIRVGGGTTLHWLGTTPRMLPNDFRLTEKYGIEINKPDSSDKSPINWPIDYDTLKPYYEMAEFEIGVSGDVSKQEYPIDESMEEYYGNYVFPMEEIPQSYMDNQIIKGLKDTSVKLNFEEIQLLLVPSPQGRNSAPNLRYGNTKVIRAKYKKPGYSLVLDDSEKEEYKALGSIWNPYMGERCEGNASCVPICPVQAKYNALKTLKKALYKINENDNLKRNPHIEIKAQSVVYRLSVDQKRISKVHLRRYTSKEKTDFIEEFIDTSDSIVILAANAFENPKILLNSKYMVTENGRQVEKTVANNSDQVGRNLMDHMVMLTWGLFPEPVYSYRGPGSTTNISSFRDGKFRSEFSAWISPLDNWGWSWPAFSPGSDLSEFLGQGLFGTDLKEALTYRLSRQVLFHFEIEQLPNPNNRVTINNQYMDALGIPRPVVHYELTDYEKKAMEQAKLASDQIFERLGIQDFTKYNATDPNTTVYNNVRYSYNGAGHIVGTHRMGSSPDDSVTDSYCKSWDHPNLYIVGAGNMTTLGTSNPTLTLSAFTIRSVESILTDLEAHF